TVSFAPGCSKTVRENFNLATALLHSFEYSEAEKVFAKVIEDDPQCAMAYWGAAMCNFHPLWEPPGPADLRKGSRVVALGRAFAKTGTRESDYLEAVATIYDEWEKLEYRTRLLKFEEAAQRVFEKYPKDNEAAIFYALALRAASDPSDKSFAKQRKAGQLLEARFTREPNHPGIAHYIIHNYDYPELAEMGLAAARSYAAIAAASAHAQHMPSHIFVRLGLWDEAIRSNVKSIDAAQCYAQNVGMKGHWDEELHGVDYLVYAHLQTGNDEEALRQTDNLKTFDEVFPQNFKDAYSFAAVPARYALERKDWKEAAQLQFNRSNLNWGKFPWEQANVTFARLLGAVHLGKLDQAHEELRRLRAAQQTLADSKDNYKANLVMIQVKSSEGWINFAEGKHTAAVNLMREAADMEDKTEKHPVTPGEILPARELLGDMLLEMNQPALALEAYREDLKRHPNRLNGLYGAARAEEMLSHKDRAIEYYKQMIAQSVPTSVRPEIVKARSVAAQ
ncbi:MAG: hypothetical protein M3Y60_00300, partial [Bacteroidota bacterium]|nr:hypothetical protein [Bacteroidota bacterium]